MLGLTDLGLLRSESVGLGPPLPREKDKGFEKIVLIQNSDERRLKGPPVLEL